jgi:hypothetical protein
MLFQGAHQWDQKVSLSWDCVDAPTAMFFAVLKASIAYTSISVKVVEWLTRSPANLVKRMPSGAQVRILSLTPFFADCIFILCTTMASSGGGLRSARWTLNTLARVQLG